MTVVEIVLIAIAALVLLLGGGGYIAMGGRTRSRDGELLDQLKQVERELAQARATDKGWERETLEAAARVAAQERFPGAEVTALQLVQVIDKPGTDADQAVFRVQTAGGDDAMITLGRTGGVWGAA